ncbi:zinc finger protein 16-like isoform X1 [Hemibagrus wyckioides]|uniref:zinc finger protein 16-like isoform X1 n=1 Tax=Hemibagrus wyckioides TaxID=337641 RepID=UPI00266CF6CF|nr:zinc finger protein 16-like isoform X1 [Hemibagrus wyckioides]
MVRSCAYPRCENRFKAKRLRPRGDMLTSHKFPSKNPDRLKQWLLALNMDINTPAASLQQKRVCSEHFVDDDYHPSEEGKLRLLRSSSVPIAFLQRAKNSSNENQESLATQTPGQQKDSGRGTTSTQLTDKHPILCLLIKSPETEQNRTESSTRGMYYYAFPVIRSHNSMSSEKENAPTSVRTCSELEESSWLKAVKSLQTPQGCNIFRSSEVMVNTHCLLELFQFCWLCQKECCITIKGSERLFSVTQDCQSCSYHRDWRSHPRSAEPTQTFHTETEHEEVEEVPSEKENAPTSVRTCSEVEESSWLKAVKSLQTPQGCNIFRSSEVMVNTHCLLELFQFCWLCQKECCITIKGSERLFSVTQDCQSCSFHRDWRSHPHSAEPTQSFHTETEHEEVEEVVVQIVSSNNECSEQVFIKKDGSYLHSDVKGEKMKKKRKRKRKTSDSEWEPSLSEELTDSELSMDEDMFTVLKEDGQGKLVVWCTQCETEASLSCSVHRHKKVFCCAQCSAGDDIQTHHIETLPVRFDDMASFQKHAEQEHGSKPVYNLCQDCGKFAVADPESRGLKKHECEHKSKFVVCPECGKRFLTEAGLKLHRTQLHSDYDHPCKYCLKVFKTRSAKLEHEQTHPKSNQPYSCPHCPEKFSSIHKRNKHVITSHRGPYKYVCDVCGKGFNDINRLRRHELIHSGEKPFKCQVCERSFNQMENLTSHMRVHTGEKPFRCEQCGESFSHNVSLKNHKRRHHDSRV